MQKRIIRKEARADCLKLAFVYVEARLGYLVPAAAWRSLEIRSKCDRRLNSADQQTFAVRADIRLW
jgi:hypothetical protein